MIASNYPVAEARTLGEAQRSGPLGFRRPVRGAAEIPDADGHQVLVYRVDGEYVLDSARLRRGDDDVVRATHVSVVDMRAGAPVAVDLSIPSRDAAEFAVHVTFACTVTDPVAVVRDGVHAGTALRSYLTSHSRIFQLGLGYAVDDVNEVRRDVDAQITAYTTVKPPHLTGISVTLAGVEVLTPDELVALERARRGQRHGHRLEREKRNQTRSLALDEEEGDHTLQYLRDENQWERDERRTGHRYVAEERDQEHRLRVRAVDDDYQRRKFLATAELVGADPRDALRLAHTAGEISSEQYAEQLALEHNRRLDREAEREERARQDRIRDTEFDRDYRIRKLDAKQSRHAEDRAERRERDRWGREDARQKHADDRADRLQALMWQREDDQHRHQESRHDRLKQLDLNLEVLREYAKRGHLDLVTLNLDQVINQLIPAPDKELPPPQRSEPAADAPRPLEAEVREEDEGAASDA